MYVFVWSGGYEGRSPGLLHAVLCMTLVHNDTQTNHLYVSEISCYVFKPNVLAAVSKGMRAVKLCTYNFCAY